jgi:hypothetical protein
VALPQAGSSLPMTCRASFSRKGRKDCKDRKEVSAYFASLRESGKPKKYEWRSIYRENRISLGRAAELCDMPIEAFMVYAGKHEAPMHYSVADLEEDRLSLTV